MPETMLALLQATRDDVAALRREQSAGREQWTATQAQLATVTAQVTALVASLEQHRADDRRELDALAETLSQERARVDRVSSRERWLAGGTAAAVTLAGAAAATVGVPLVAAAAELIGGG